MSESKTGKTENTKGGIANTKRGSDGKFKPRTPGSAPEKKQQPPQQVAAPEVLTPATASVQTPAPVAVAEAPAKLARTGRAVLTDQGWLVPEPEPDARALK